MRLVRGCYTHPKLCLLAPGHACRRQLADVTAHHKNAASTLLLL
jgi:hypothetical protein